MKLLFILNLFVATNLFGQIGHGSLIKAGGFVYFNSSGLSGYSVSLELEKVWSKKEFLSFGPRIDYLYSKYQPGNLYTGDLGPKFFLGYEIKFYPLNIKTPHPYHGLFIGVEPLFLMQRPNDDYTRYGPGLGTFIGYQHLLRERVSLSFEGNMVYFQNINYERAPSNSDDRYFFLYASIKVGFRLRKSSK